MRVGAPRGKTAPPLQALSTDLSRLRNMTLGEVVQRGAARLYRRTGADRLDFPLLPQDVVSATDRLSSVTTSRARHPGPMRVGWVMVPPSAGSGGHTTIFRMVEAVERAGHTCTLFLYDRHGGNLTAREDVIRKGWPSVRAKVRDASAGIVGVDICVATSWDSAHVLASRVAREVRRAYFIQDYEPLFYPHGAEYALAEATYRFGFRNIALGEMVARRLREEVGVIADVVPFGCDTDVYKLTGSQDRRGVVFYAKPGATRRGYMLGRLALDRFHAMHPEVEIHVYGDPAKDLPFPVIRHGRMGPPDLNELYNSTVAGLAFSFTNISLVAEEMLASGTIPIVNESPDARADMPNEYVHWAKPTPEGVAHALSRTVGEGDIYRRAELAAASVASRSWKATQLQVVRILEREVFGVPRCVDSSGS